MINPFDFFVKDRQVTSASRNGKPSGCPFFISFDASQMKQRRSSDVKTLKGEVSPRLMPSFSSRHYMIVNDMKLSLSSLRHGVLNALLALFISTANAVAAPDLNWGVPDFDAPALAQLPPANANGEQIIIKVDQGSGRLYFQAYVNGDLQKPTKTGSISVNGSTMTAKIQNNGTYKDYYYVEDLDWWELRDIQQNGSDVIFEDTVNIGLSNKSVTTTINETPQATPVTPTGPCKFQLTKTNQGNCSYTIGIEGATDPDYVYVLIDSNGKVRGHKSGNGGDVTFNHFYDPRTTTQTFTAYYVKYDDWQQKGEAAVAEGTICGSIVVAARPQSPQRYKDKANYYYCDKTSGVDEIRYDIDLATTSTVYLYRDGKLVSQKSVFEEDGTVRFINLEAGTYYAYAENVDGCRSQQSDPIYVIHKEYNPEVTPDFATEICISELRKQLTAGTQTTSPTYQGKSKKITISYVVPAKDDANGNAQTYDFSITVTGNGHTNTLTRTFLLGHTNSDGQQTLIQQENNDQLYYFYLDITDPIWQLSGGADDVTITVNTTVGQTPGCSAQPLTVKIKKSPDIPTPNASYSQSNNGVICELSEANYWADLAGSDENTVYHWYLKDPTLGGNTTSEFETGSALSKKYKYTYEEQYGKMYQVKVPSDATFDADGNYHLTWYVVAEDVSLNGCKSEPATLEEIIRPNDAHVRDYTDGGADTRWTLCEDSDPANIQEFFYPGDGTY